MGLTIALGISIPLAQPELHGVVPTLQSVAPVQSVPPIRPSPTGTVATLLSIIHLSVLLSRVARTKRSTYKGLVKRDGTDDLMQRSWLRGQPADVHVYIFQFLYVFDQSRQPQSPLDCWTRFLRNSVTDPGSVACGETFINWGRVEDRDLSVQGS